MLEKLNDSLGGFTIPGELVDSMARFRRKIEEAGSLTVRVGRLIPQHQLDEQAYLERKLEEMIIAKWNSKHIPESKIRSVLTGTPSTMGDGEFPVGKDVEFVYGEPKKRFHYVGEVKGHVPGHHLIWSGDIGPDPVKVKNEDIVGEVK